MRKGYKLLVTPNSECSSRKIFQLEIDYRKGGKGEIIEEDNEIQIWFIKFKFKIMVMIDFFSFRQVVTLINSKLRAENECF